MATTARWSTAWSCASSVKATTASSTWRHRRAASNRPAWFWPTTMCSRSTSQGPICRPATVSSRWSAKGIRSSDGQRGPGFRPGHLRPDQPLGLSQPGTMHDLPDLAFVDLEDRDGQPRHDGLAPSPERGPLDLGSPDIWVNREANSDRPARCNASRLARSTTSTCEFHNLGFAAANGTRVQLFWADPARRWPIRAAGVPTDFKSAARPGNTWTGDVPARGEVDAGPFEWDVPSGYSRLTLFAAGRTSRRSRAPRGRCALGQQHHAPRPLPSG